MRRTRSSAAGRLLALAWLPLACSNGAEAKRDDREVTVEVSEVEASLLRDVETFGGALLAAQSVMLRSETDGVVAGIEFAEGQRVEAGDVLVRLRDDEQRARVAEAEAQLALAEEVAKRTGKLVTRDAASTAQRDEAVAQLGVARARLNLTRIELERTRIQAPFAGVVGIRMISVGDRVTDETPLVQLDSVDDLELIFPVSEHGVLFGRVGAPIEISVRPYPGEKFAGEVYFISPTVDPTTRRVTLKARVPNPNGRLRPGLFANVDLEIARREQALQLPESAVVYDRGGTYVWRVDPEGRAERVPIELGLRRRGRVEVTLGLQPGDRVVSAGTHKVSEGNQLVVRAPTAGGTARREAPGGAAGEGT